jgi:5-methylcytosine-specific restriction endonuclease McrA
MEMCVREKTSLQRGMNYRNAKDELHFDHILPFSKGGTSIKAENVQLLCARHNLAESDKII